MTAASLPPPVVSAPWLAARQAAAASGDGPPVRLADVRAYLDERRGHDAYLAGHLPGAVFVDLDTVLAAPPSAEAGRHPLPDPETFAAGLAAAGIGDDHLVVAYDDAGGMIAGRLVWMLRILGQPASLLDGGITAWSGPLERGPGAADEAQRTVRPWPAAALASADDVSAHVAAGGVVVDSRAPERYRGELEPIDPRAGHVPGAVNAPIADNLDDDRRFRQPDELARRFEAIGADGDAIFYCGSGVSACHNLLAMEAAGHPIPRLYVGSWSQWSSDPGRPLATGPSPEPAVDLFHLALPEDWAAARAAGEYRVSTRGRSLDEVGFVHCARRHQVAGVADRLYGDLSDLVMLAIDPARLAAEVRDEPPVAGSDELFPHVYGPIPTSAVVVSAPWRRPPGGRWADPPALVP